MGKRANEAKKRKRQNGTGVANGVSVPVKSKAKVNGINGSGINGNRIGKHVDDELDHEDENDNDDDADFDLDVESAVMVLQDLVEHSEKLMDKRLKVLKGAVYDLHRVMTERAGVGSSLASRISAALSDYRFTDALVYLFEMYTRRIPPKLGAIQRWVRECDATSGADGTPGDKEALQCLDLILRIANMGKEDADANALGSSSADGATRGAVVRRKQAWVAREKTGQEVDIWRAIKEGSFTTQTASGQHPSFRKVHFLPGPSRRPPNVYDSTVYASSPDAIALTPASARRKPSKLDVPGVPGAFIVLDVFTPDECSQIVKAAVDIGFEKDEAATGSARLKTSILARNFLWLADQSFLDHFYSQILPFVPPSAPRSDNGNGGGKVRGINARFRVYEYTDNQVYRPHIDGAWPAAGLHPETGEYMHDSMPSDDPLWSRYTLLVYLNDDIPKGTGCTTFFLPAPNEMGVMEAMSVRPIQGAVLCFPHGDTQGSLLHEGSAVGEGGGKFVIRTDLLYEAKGFGEFKPPASVSVQHGGKGEEGAGG